VVSLLDMLEFAAADFVELSHKLGLILGEVNKPTASSGEIPLDKLGDVLTHCCRLGLNVTREHVVCFMEEMARTSPPGSVHITGEEIRIKNPQANYLRAVYYAEVIYSTMRAELESRQFRALPAEKLVYCDIAWLTDSPMFQKFPDTVDEFQSAGRCFAYGENTACIFHLMRVTDFYLKKVADSLGVTYSAHTWHEIGNTIQKAMEQKYATKTNDWKRQEPFYAEILTDIQAISRGHRNPALHELQKKYDEREAQYMLAVIEGFAQHVARHL
jgi:hypothetical protein